MKYQLKDICSITKGAIGIMKADGGKYPLVALSDERRNHSEFQFDANAVIVPLISSTGHGHASMKRVHYQEGKFALGNILCAVIPNDEKQLNAKYLHLYLQQFKETLLVPLMKGAANVSLPMNKLADVEIEVPSLERQLEIIALEDEAAEYKNELEERLFLQDGDVTKLRQALLREAMQGKLTKQNLKNGNAKDLLEKIKTEKTKLGIKEKPLAEIKEEEIPFDIPDNWVWCKLGQICEIKGGKRVPNGYQLLKIPTPHIYIRVSDMKNGTISDKDLHYIDENVFQFIKNYTISKDDIYMTIVGGTIGKCGIVPEAFHNMNLTENAAKIIPHFVNKIFLWYCLDSPFCQGQFIDKTKQVGVQKMALNRFSNSLISLPPLPEQNRIVKKLEELMKLCDELQASIQASKTENEKLLQGALRDALKKKEEAKVISLPVLQPMEEKHFLKRKILATYIINQSLSDNHFGDVKFEKILHLSDYFAIKRNFGQKYYQQAAGPYDNGFTIPYFQQVVNSKWFSRSKHGNQFIFSAGQNHDKSTNTYSFFSANELQRVNEIIAYFKKYDYEQPEIVSTLYAVWNNRIIRQEQISNDLLIEDFYTWDEQKKKYEHSRLEKALEWMSNKSFVPDGWGSVIEKVKKKK